MYIEREAERIRTSADEERLVFHRQEQENEKEKEEIARGRFEKTAEREKFFGGVPGFLRQGATARNNSKKLQQEAAARSNILVLYDKELRQGATARSSSKK